MDNGFAELSEKLLKGSLSDSSLLAATDNTPDYPILPWVNVVKIGGQSIMDRGRSAVGPVVDEIVANLSRHKMILGTGAGTRARHVYSLAIDLGLPVGVLTVLGTAVAWQNAQMLQYLLARHGVAFLEPEGFAALPHYLMERGAVICQGMPPYKLWEENPSLGRIPPERDLAATLGVAGRLLGLTPEQMVHAIGIVVGGNTAIIRAASARCPTGRTSPPPKPRARRSSSPSLLRPA